MYGRIPLTRLVATLLLTGIPALDADGITRPSAQEEQVPISVSLEIDGHTYATDAPGSCTHAPKASIYEVVAEMWTVRQRGDDRSLHFTLWKPADGTESMFSFSLTGGTNVRISTVRGGQVSGAGTARLDGSGKGGTFTIEGKEATGGKITGTIRCDAFTPHVAAGG